MRWCDWRGRYAFNTIPIDQVHHNRATALKSAAAAAANEKKKHAHTTTEITTAATHQRSNHINFYRVTDSWTH